MLQGGRCSSQQAARTPRPTERKRTDGLQRPFSKEDIQTATLHTKRRSALIIRDMQIKASERLTSHPSEWPPPTDRRTANAAERVQQRAPSHPVGGPVHGYSHRGGHHGGARKSTESAATGASHPTAERVSGRGACVTGAGARGQPEAPDRGVGKDGHRHAVGPTRSETRHLQQRGWAWPQAHCGTGLREERRSTALRRGVQREATSNPAHKAETDSQTDRMN